MARHAEGWKLVWRPGHAIPSVRFTHNRRRRELSTGTADPGEAAAAAARIYADWVHKHPSASSPAPRPRAAQQFEELIARWLASDSIDRSTANTWIVYGRHWVDHFERLSAVSARTCASYMKARLKVVQPRTVTMELGTLERFLRWCEKHAFLKRHVVVPRVPSGTVPTRRVRRRAAAPDLTLAQVRSLIAALPELSDATNTDRFPVRAYFLVLYETALPPATLERLSSPEHYAKGRRSLSMTKDIDRGRWARDVPLSARARAALDRIIDHPGLIFGKHDYRAHLRAAADKVLGGGAGETLTASHLRSARIRHLVEKTGHVAGVRWLTGLKQNRTVQKHASATPTQRDAERMLRALEGRKVR
jgi:hypothetical protein